MSAAIATLNKDMNGLLQVVMSAFLLESSEDGAVFLWARSIVEQWDREDEHRILAEGFMERAAQRRKGTKFENDIRTSSRQIHENFLTSFGIDPASPPWAAMIDLAIKDADPSRVLKGCEHTFVSDASVSPDSAGWAFSMPARRRCIVRCTNTP